jgi:hypothetical protein
LSIEQNQQVIDRRIMPRGHILSMTEVQSNSWLFPPPLFQRPEGGIKTPRLIRAFVNPIYGGAKAHDMRNARATALHAGAHRPRLGKRAARH